MAIKFNNFIIPFCMLLIFQCKFIAFALLNPVDFLALQSIRKSLKDLPRSNFFASWDFTSDPCNFPGVYCESNKVIALNLGDPRAGSPGLTGHLDPAIGKLSSLTELTLVPGRVYGALPESLSQLKKLRFLAISRNFISGEVPAGLGQVRTLRTLDLSYNQLIGGVPTVIGTLPELSHVILCHNRLTGAIPVFESQSLTRLDLKHNSFSGSLAPNGLPSSMQYLSLSSNRLTGSIDRVVTRLDQLNYLDLSMNQLSGFIPVRIFKFPMTSLQLQRNMFIGRVEPDDEVTIGTVDLSYNRLSGEISPMFSGVRNLYLNNNRFTGQVPGGLVDRLMDSSIQVLYLQHNFLTGIAISPSAAFPLSSTLCLQYNCMVPPLPTRCPLKAGDQKTRPTSQCGSGWKG